jgi:hypothetical protein
MSKKQIFVDIAPLYKELAVFIHGMLIPRQQPTFAGAQTGIPTTAFDDYWWRNSPLFRQIRVSIPVENEYLAPFVGFLEDRFELGKEFDQPAHEQREQIGQTWGMLRLLPLLSDVTFYRELTFVTYAHLLRSFNLRLRSYWAEMPGIRLPADLGLPSAPLRWSLGPFSVMWVYAAYMICVAARQINPSTRKQMILHSERAMLLIENERYTSYLTSGDLVLADALVTVLLDDEKVQWDELAILARVSPISRICRLNDLYKLANANEDKLMEGLNPRNMPRRSKMLLLLAGSDQIPGIHHACAQQLASTCHPGGHPRLLEEAAQTIYSLAFDRYHPLKETGSKPTEADYHTGALLLRTYLLAQHDGFRISTTIRRCTSSAPSF